MKAKHDKGFTLIEVMVALAVVAIVSTSLFQMFVTTSYVNKDAQVMDLANIIAVGQAESFKALTTDPVVGTATIYYDSHGTSLTTPVSGGIPAGAVVQVDSTVTPTGLDVDSTGYFPSFVGQIDLSDYSEWDVQITLTHQIYFRHVEPHIDPGEGWIPLTPPTGFIMQNHVLPIKVTFTSGSQSSRTIHLINNSAVEADNSSVEANVYFFTQVSDLSLPAQQSVTLIPVSGYSSLTTVKQTTPKNTKYHLELTVSKLIGTVPQFMFTYSTDKYFYH